MKFLVAFILTSLSFTVSAQQTRTSDLISERLRGPVQSVLIKGYKGAVVSGRPTNGRLLHTTLKVYNSNGYLTETSFKIGFDTIAGRSVRNKSSQAYYRYDDNGYLIGSVSYNDDGSIRDSSVQEVDKMGNKTDWIIYDKKRKRKWQYTSEYDNAGNLLETTEYNDGELTQRHMYRYNENNQRIMERQFNSDNVMVWSETFAYDKQGNKTEVADFNGNGSFRAKYTYIYNEKGKPIEEHIFNKDNSDRFEKVLTKYDEEGNPIEIKQYDENGTLSYMGRLDKWGNHLSDVEYNADGTVKNKLASGFKYDEEGNEREEYNRFVDGSHSKITSSYVYDQFGNWVRKVVMEDGEMNRVVERYITYYK